MADKITVKFDDLNGNTVEATTFTGTLKGNADTATKATQDGSGNIITTTYAKVDGTTDSAFTINTDAGAGESNIEIDASTGKIIKHTYNSSSSSGGSVLAGPDGSSVSSITSNEYTLPSTSGTLALQSQIPTSLKNPNTLKLNVNGTANAYTYDGSKQVSVDFYAPTTYGTKGQVLVSQGQNADPTWGNADCHGVVLTVSSKNPSDYSDVSLTGNITKANFTCLIIDNNASNVGGNLNDYYKALEDASATSTATSTSSNTIGAVTAGLIVPPLSTNGYTSIARYAPAFGFVIHSTLGYCFVDGIMAGSNAFTIIGHDLTGTLQEVGTSTDIADCFYYASNV